MRLQGFAILLLLCFTSAIRSTESLPANDYKDVIDLPCTEGYVMDGQGNCVPISDPITPDPVDYCDYFPEFC